MHAFVGSSRRLTACVAAAGPATVRPRCPGPVASRTVTRGRRRWQASPEIDAGCVVRITLAAGGTRSRDPNPLVGCRGHRRRRAPVAEGCPPRRRHPARRGRGPGDGRRAGPRRHRASSPSSPATTSAAPGRVRTRWSRPASRRVVYAVPTPTRRPPAAPGAAAAGIDVEQAVLRDEAERLNPVWLHAVRTGGRSSPGSSPPPSTAGPPRRRHRRWITGPVARADVHRLRAGCDAIARRHRHRR